MEENQDDGRQIFQIRASELFNRFKHRDNRYNFCRQKGKQY